MRCMLQQIELFLTLRHAIRYADIWILRYLVDRDSRPPIVYFFGALQAWVRHLRSKFEDAFGEDMRCLAFIELHPVPRTIFT